MSELHAYLLIKTIFLQLRYNALARKDCKLKVTLQFESV